MKYRITHNASDASEDVTQETLDALTKAKLLKYYTVEEIKPATRPSEKLDDDATAKKPKAGAGA